LSSNLFKAGWVVINDDARVINSNELIEQKLQNAARMNNYQPMLPEGEEESGGFSTGLSAESIDTLLDPDSERAVLKSASAQELDRVKQELSAAKEELSRVQAQIGQLKENAQAEIDNLREETLKKASDQGYQDGY